MRCQCLFSFYVQQKYPDKNKDNLQVVKKSLIISKDYNAISVS